MQPKISVIVPICNVEDYLRPCLESLVSQTLQELEIILLNDGSTDGSAAIIDEFAARLPAEEEPAIFIIEFFPDHLEAEVGCARLPPFEAASVAFSALINIHFPDRVPRG